MVSKPYALPSPPEGPFVMLDVAFAGGDNVKRTHAFIHEAGEKLRLWVDHHEHAQGWPRYRHDPRFVLVSSRLAHACPELVTAELVERAGDVRVVCAHHDFDGLMSAVRFICGGREPYEGADEDARAADSPGRGHTLSPRGERLAAALDEAMGELEETGYLMLYRAVAESLRTGREEPSLGSALDHYFDASRALKERARNLAKLRKVEAPGVCVLRVDARLDARMRKAVLHVLEESATVGLVLEGSGGRHWATAATYFEGVNLEAATELDRGRHDFRFGPTHDADGLVRLLSTLAAAVG